MPHCAVSRCLLRARPSGRMMSAACCGGRSFSTAAFDPANTRLVFRSRSTLDIFATAALLQLCSSVSVFRPATPSL